MKKIILITILGLLIVVVGICSPNKKRVRIKKIVDGDTVKIVYQGKTVNCRLIGIDTPESRKNYKAKKDAWRSGQSLKTIIKQGRKATRYLRTILHKGDSVYIAFDRRKKDRYGRWLVYLYLPDGRMINKMIIRAGYAVPMTIKPCVKYSTEFVSLYNSAKFNRVGLWK